MHRLICSISFESDSAMIIFFAWVYTADPCSIHEICCISKLISIWRIE